MEPRLAFTSFGNTGLFADRVKRVEIIQPQATTEPASERIELGMGKELQR